MSIYLGTENTSKLSDCHSMSTRVNERSLHHICLTLEPRCAIDAIVVIRCVYIRALGHQQHINMYTVVSFEGPTWWYQMITSRRVAGRFKRAPYLTTYDEASWSKYYHRHQTVPYKNIVQSYLSQCTATARRCLMRRAVMRRHSMFCVWFRCVWITRA